MIPNESEQELKFWWFFITTHQVKDYEADSIPESSIIDTDFNHITKP